MYPININELKAQDAALDQKIDGIHAYIVSELKAFPANAQGMGRRTDAMEFTAPGSFLRKPATFEKPCYRLALAYSIDKETDRLDHCASIIVIGTDGTFCFANHKMLSTPTERIISSPEDFATHLMNFFEEFRDMASAQEVLGLALRGMPMKLGCPLWFKLGEVRGGGVPKAQGNNVQSSVTRSNTVQSDTDQSSTDQDRNTWETIGALVALVMALIVPVFTLFGSRNVCGEVTWPPVIFGLVMSPLIFWAYYIACKAKKYFVSLLSLIIMAAMLIANFFVSCSWSMKIMTDIFNRAAEAKAINNGTTISENYLPPEDALPTGPHPGTITGPWW